MPGYVQPPRARAPIVLVAGPPAAGKGTQCRRIATTYGLVHVSVGDLVRAQANEVTEIGRIAKDFMGRGDFLPDDTILSLVKERLSRPDIIEHGVLLDGFPRTRVQAEAFVKDFEVDMFVLFQVKNHIAEARAFGRLTDPVTNSIYHVQFLPPPAEVVDRLKVRDGDADEAAVRKRIAAYEIYIGEITPIFDSKMRVVDGEPPPDQVFESFRKIVNELHLAPSQPSSSAAPKDEDDWSDDEEAPKGTGLQLSVEIAPNDHVGAGGGERMVAVSISVPETESGSDTLERDAAGKVKRPPTDVCCVVDISGSMAQEATYEDENENVKSDGLTYLDIVKHAVKTVMHILGDQDRLSLVAFDNNAAVVFPLGFMNAEGRKRATDALDALAPRGRTDIWKGLHTGLESMRTAEKTAGWRPKTVLLLTDGVPNEVPTRGHIPELRDYKECNPDFSFMINTFGFGYKLDSELLLDLAIEGQGTYGFIPDALIVGTSFVDSISNVLSTFTQKATVHLTAKGGARFTGPVVGVGEHMVTETSWGRVVNLGPLQFGSTREVVLPLFIPAGTEPYLDAIFVFPTAGNKESKATGQGTSRTTAAFAVAAYARSDTVDIGYLAVKEAVARHQDEAQAHMAALVTRLEGKEVFGGEWCATLRTDVEGRATKALVGTDRFERWGKHYLRAFTRAQQVQYCTNFMDKSLQDYGGALFRALREEGDGIFVSLPPPKPSARPNVQAARRASAPAVAAAAPDMAVYYGGGGGG